jgi:2-oxoglutarate decarboxylase
MLRLIHNRSLARQFSQSCPAALSRPTRTLTHIAPASNTRCSTKNVYVQSPIQTSSIRAYSADTTNSVQRAAHQLALAYQQYGHIIATNINPLHSKPLDTSNSIFNYEHYGLTGDSKIQYSGQLMTADQYVTMLRSVYCNTAAYQYSHIVDPAEREWITEHIHKLHTTQLTTSQHRNAYMTILQSDAFDNFLGTKFGQFKRYGLTGLETMLVALEHTLSTASRHNVSHVVLGMYIHLNIYILYIY